MTMAKNTSILLGEHFEKFIGSQLDSGRFNSASEVIRAGLRLLENSENQLEILRNHLKISEAQADAGKYADYSLASLIAEMDAEYDANKK